MGHLERFILWIFQQKGYSNGVSPSQVSSLLRVANVLTVDLGKIADAFLNLKEAGMIRPGVVNPLPRCLWQQIQFPFFLTEKGKEEAAKICEKPENILKKLRAIPGSDTRW